MSGQKDPCVVEYFGASNQGVGEAIGPALEMVEAGEANELGQFVVSCERCGADFALAAEIGSPIEMKLLTEPEPSEDACAEATCRQEGDWVMNLSGRAWFPVDVLLDGSSQEEQDPASDQESGEQYFTPAELLEKYEAIGKKAEDRYAAEYMGKPDYEHWQLPKSGIEGIFKLSTGARANFSWNTRPEFYRPENRLPGGSLTTKSGEYGVDERTELYMFERIIVGDSVSINIVNCSYRDGKPVGEEPRLLDQAKLKEVNDALTEIEQAIDDPSQEMDWHVYGRSYVW